MKKTMLLITTVLITTLSNAQTIKGKLDNNFIIKDHEKLIVGGYEYDDKKATFKATLYDENLNVLKEYQKLLPFESDNVKGYQSMYGNLLFICMKTKPYNYYLELTKDLKEKSFYEDKKYVAKGANEIIVNDINTDSSNIDYDFDLKERTLTMLQSTQAENGTVFKKNWSASFTQYKTIEYCKQSIDNNNIVIDFRTKEKGEMKEYLAKVDKKTGTIQNTIPVVYPNEKDALRFQTSYYDKQSKNTLFVGQFNSSQCYDMFENSKIENYALGLIILDKDGKVVSSSKINFPEYNVTEPKHVNFKYRSVKILKVGKLSNGNYFITAVNKAHYHTNGAATSNTMPFDADIIIGYSNYEIDSKLNVVNSNFTIEENYAKNYVISEDFGDPSVVCSNVSDDGKYAL